MTVLNPLCRVNEHIMDDADLAGPLIFCFFFATFLLFSGKPQFEFITVLRYWALSAFTAS
ncbi:hypothetical protein BJV77DRAFT_737520 [Russula vinacea]|nr:hypothetical protein BJV77DRAFT_737520 [Russula vinacea]